MDRYPTSTVLINAAGIVLVAGAMFLALKPSDPEPHATATSAPVAAKSRAKTAPAPSGAAAAAPGPPSEQESAVRETVTRYFTSSEPVDCVVVYTRRFIDRSFDGSGREALRECRRNSAAHSVQDADEAVIERVSIRGDRATVVAGADGGLFDGRVDTIALVRRAGRWKVDAITAVEIDRKRFDRANYEIAVERGFTPGEARCLVGRQHREASTAELKRAILAPDRDDGAEDRGHAGLECVSVQRLRREFTRELREDAASRGVPPSFMGCVARRLLNGMTPAELRRFIFAGERPSPAEMNRIFSSCVRASSQA